MVMVLYSQFGENNVMMVMMLLAMGVMIFVNMNLRFQVNVAEHILGPCMIVREVVRIHL